MVNLLLITLTILVLSAGEVFSVQCLPPCTAQGTFEANPCDCSEYYYCLNAGTPADAPLTCPPERPYFNPATETCGNDPIVCPPRNCPVTCSAAGVMIVDPNDCSHYYLCDASLVPQGPVSCPLETPVFNGIACITDSVECCAGSIDLCRPYCKAANTEIIDPDDCTKFYICVTVGIANELYHTSCPTGQNFDIVTSKCSPIAPCITLCQLFEGGDGGSDDCIESMQCTQAGIFPMCTSCQKGYFDCLANFGQAIPRICFGETVFNTDPSYAYCVDPDDCPHQP